jgi:hypothetical protein
VARKISQREARRLRKRVQTLEFEHRARMNAWGKEYPGIDIGQMSIGAEGKIISALRTARKLKHAVVALAETDGTIYFFAVPL